jgi:hypothetical protein
MIKKLFLTGIAIVLLALMLSPGALNTDIVYADGGGPPKCQTCR